MAKCKDCLHYEACGGYLPTDLDKDVFHLCAQGKADEIPDIEERCSEFKDRTSYTEVVHGHKVERIVDYEFPAYKVFDCSECGYDVEIWHNYCPNCGADMR